MTGRFMSSLVTPLRAERDNLTFPLSSFSSSFCQFPPEEENKAKQISNLCSHVRRIFSEYRATDHELITIRDDNVIPERFYRQKNGAPKICLILILVFHSVV